MEEDSGGDHARSNAGGRNVEEDSGGDHARSNAGGRNVEEVTERGSNSAPFCKEAILKTILSMDAHKRRQLIEEPRSKMSRYLLDYLVKENQTAKARQLSTMRFRINTSAHSLYNELEVASTSETHIDLNSFSKEFSDEFLEEVKEFLKEKDDTPTVEDDEIQVLAPPVKEPPLCIDLDVEVPISIPPPGMLYR